MTGMVSALGVGIAGIATAAGVRLAQAPETFEIPGYATGGGAVVAVSMLVYVTKLLLSGGLVPRSVAEYQRELSAGIRAAADREAEAMHLAEQYRKDNEAMRRVLHKIDMHLGGTDDRSQPRRRT